MTTATLVARPPLVGRPVIGSMLLFVGAVATAMATLAGNGSVFIGLLPLALSVGAYAFYVLPIRYPLFVLIFLSLTLDSSGEGPWDSPLAPIGDVLNYNVSRTLGIGGLKLPGAAVLLAMMLGLLVLRSFTNTKTDSRGRTPAALPFFGGLLISLASILGLIALGKVWGGDLQMAKIQTQTYVLLLITAYVSVLSLRGLQDYRILARIVVAAAVIRSAYVMFVVHHITGALSWSTDIEVAATHGDSLLFSVAAVLLVARLMERPSLRSVGWCALLLPVLALGMHLNGRRLVWIELVAGLLTVFVLIRRGRMKRIVVRAALLSLPLLVAYVAVGWNSQAKIFGPVQTYRSLTEGEADSSTLYRDLENYNLMQTMRVRPLTGTGFGLPFVEIAVLPNISSMFKEYQYMPHNSILGLWAYTGPFGFTGLTLVLVIAAYFATRSYRLASLPDERVAALMILAGLTIYLQHCWGDIGFSERRSIVLIGPMLALAGQLAHQTGAYFAKGSVRADVRRAA
jgi:O-Antigen ligase